MITNPQIGQRVIYVRPNSCRSMHVGIITRIIPSGGLFNEVRVSVDFGEPLDNYNIQIWLCHLNALEEVEIDQVWLDKQRRHKHAMQWF